MGEKDGGKREDGSKRWSRQRKEETDLEIYVMPDSHTGYYLDVFMIFPTLLKAPKCNWREVPNSFPLHHHTITLTKIKEDMLLTVMDYLFQASFKSLQVGFYSVLKCMETNGCLEGKKISFINLKKNPYGLLQKIVGMSCLWNTQSVSKVWTFKVLKHFNVLWYKTGIEELKSSSSALFLQDEWVW